MTDPVCQWCTTGTEPAVQPGTPQIVLCFEHATLFHEKLLKSKPGSNFSFRVESAPLAGATQNP